MERSTVRCEPTSCCCATSSAPRRGAGQHAAATCRLLNGSRPCRTTRLPRPAQSPRCSLSQLEAGHVADLPTYATCRGRCEVEAESVAYVVATAQGMHASEIRPALLAAELGVQGLAGGGEAAIMSGGRSSCGTPQPPQWQGGSGQFSGSSGWTRPRSSQVVKFMQPHSRQSATTPRRRCSCSIVASISGSLRSARARQWRVAEVLGGVSEQRPYLGKR